MLPLIGSYHCNADTPRKVLTSFVILGRMDTRIESLKRGILLRIETGIQNVIEICESPIEQIFLLNFLKFSTCLNEGDDPTFNNLTFISTTIDPKDADNQSNLGNNSCSDSVPRTHEKLIGFQLVGEWETWDWSDLENGTAKEIRKYFEVFPQYEIDINGNNFRIDIAIIMKRMHFTEGGWMDEAFRRSENLHAKLLSKRKIAIECDGHEFHSSKEQKARDNKRSRLLQSDGWRVLRYSGSEINSFEKVKQFNKIMSEIMDVFRSL